MENGTSLSIHLCSTLTASLRAGPGSLSLCPFVRQDEECGAEGSACEEEAAAPCRLNCPPPSPATDGAAGSVCSGAERGCPCPSRPDSSPGQTPSTPSADSFRTIFNKNNKSVEKMEENISVGKYFNREIVYDIVLELPQQRVQPSHVPRDWRDGE